MPTVFDVRALASSVRIQLDDTLNADEQAAIRSQWADLIIDEPDTPTAIIRAGIGGGAPHEDRDAVEARSATDLADAIASQVILRGISDLSGESLMLHASAVALDDGRVIGFVGPSGRGKTTAAAALGRSYGYVTDETLAVRADGSVIPFPKPLSVGDRPQTKHIEAASSLGLRVAPTDGLRLGAIVLLDRRASIERPYVESISIFEALPELVPQTSYLSVLEHPLRTLVEIAIKSGGVRRVVYSEAETLPSIIDDVLGSVDLDHPILTDVASVSKRGCNCSEPRDGSESGASATEDRPGTHRRVGHNDSLMVDDSLLVLTTNQVVVLEGVGPVVWLAADGSTEDELREAALQQLPEPPEGVDPVVVVSAALEQLVDAQLLVKA